MNGKKIKHSWNSLKTFLFDIFLRYKLVKNSYEQSQNVFILLIFALSQYRLDNFFIRLFLAAYAASLSASSFRFSRYRRCFSAAVKAWKQHTHKYQKLSLAQFYSHESYRIIRSVTHPWSHSWEVTLLRFYIQHGVTQGVEMMGEWGGYGLKLVSKHILGGLLIIFCLPLTTL